MTRVQSNWEQNQWRSSHLRHYQVPVPCEKGPSRNSLLQCNRMPVKIKNLEHSIHQLRLKQLRSTIEKNLNKRKSTSPFVTRVEIIKTRKKKRSKSTDSVSPRETNTNKEVSFIITNNEKQGDSCSARNALLCETMDTRQADINDENALEHSDFAEASEITELEMDVSKERTDNLYLPEIPDEERENVEYLIKCLNRRIRNPIKEYHRPVSSSRPTAAYARPTKGEIALSMKGPVLLPPVSKAVKAASTQANEKETRLNVESLRSKLPHSMSARNKSAISSESDSVVAKGRNVYGHRAAMWSGHGRVQYDQLDRNNRLCHSCRQQSAIFEVGITGERMKTAVCGENKQKNTCGHSAQQLSQSSTQSRARKVINRDSRVKQHISSHNGVKYPYEIQVNLDRLKSYDYESPVPPPSLSNSDDEDTQARTIHG